MMKGIALDLHIAMSTFDTISCVQFSYYNSLCYSWNCGQLLSNQMLPLSSGTIEQSRRLWLPGTFVNSWPIS